MQGMKRIPVTLWVTIALFKIGERAHVRGTTWSRSPDARFFQRAAMVTITSNDGSNLTVRKS